MMPARTAAIVLGIMGLMAALLAATGIFGMASYSVSAGYQRTRPKP